MVYSSENAECTALSNKKNYFALEATLQQSLCHLKGLLLDFEQLEIESRNYKTLFCSQQEKCESKECVGSEALKKVIEIKDNVIQSVASALTRLNETRDMNIIDEAFKILCGETAILTPPKEMLDAKSMSPKKEPTSISEEFNDESLSEIDGTPGRTSPIIFSKKLRSASSSDYREKKKCPDSWATPNNKTVKLMFRTPTNRKGGKMRQARFMLVKQNSVVDLTSSPELAARPARHNEGVASVQLNIKKETNEDEDTIQPSPTSLNSNFITMFKSNTRNSPLKLNKNSPKKVTKLSPAKYNKLQLKTENVSKSNVENECHLKEEIIKMEDSINLMRPNRLATPVKSLKVDPEETDCEIDSSMSLLPRLKAEKISPDNKGNMNSPFKRPLLENINCTNLQSQGGTESSVTSLSKNVDAARAPEPPKPKKDEVFKVETIYKEPTVRKKAEKRALPGWSCDECKNFYAELYKNGPPEMLAKKMDECSKHRGRNNPVRPKTPPGFWNPRWDVPEDTEQFNRRNNAV